MPTAIGYYESLSFTLLQVTQLCYYLILQSGFTHCHSFCYYLLFSFVITYFCYNFFFSFFITDLFSFVISLVTTSLDWFQKTSKMLWLCYIEQKKQADTCIAYHHYPNSKLQIFNTLACGSIQLRRLQKLVWQRHGQHTTKCLQYGSQIVIDTLRQW